MKKILILLLIFINIQDVKSQEKKIIYISVDSELRYYYSLEYREHKAFFTVKRENRIFTWDLFEFLLESDVNSEKIQTILELSEEIIVEKELNLVDITQLKTHDVCQNHLEFCDSTIIFAQLMENTMKGYKYRIWKAHYGGTQMNALPLNDLPFIKKKKF